MNVIGPAAPDEHLRAPPIGKRGGEHALNTWRAQKEKLSARGAQPEDAWLRNLSESVLFASLQRDVSPCLTRSCQHIWICSHGRFLTTSERARLQGFDDQIAVCVTDSQFQAMLGNSMSADALKMIIGAVLPALTPAAEPEGVNV